MKRMYYVIFSLVGLLSSYSYGMEDPGVVRAAVKVYFVPQDQEQMMGELDSLLSNAKRQVLVAMYWLKDDYIIDKLIALKHNKHHRVDVQVIFDESLDITDQLIKKLMANDIVPVVNLSKSFKTGIMHNKFIVIDESVVFTGSANFTRTALDPQCAYYNFENVTVFNSRDIARKYQENFYEIERQIFNFYLSALVKYQLPAWMKNLFKNLYNQSSTFKEVVRFKLEEQGRGSLKGSDRDFIRDFFGIVQARRRDDGPYKKIKSDGPSPKQINILLKHGIPIEDIEKMSQQEAWDLIGELFALASQQKAQYDKGGYGKPSYK